MTLPVRSSDAFSMSRTPSWWGWGWHCCRVRVAVVLSCLTGLLDGLLTRLLNGLLNGCCTLKWHVCCAAKSLQWDSCLSLGRVLMS